MITGDFQNMIDYSRILNSKVIFGAGVTVRGWKDWSKQRISNSFSYLTKVFLKASNTMESYTSTLGLHTFLLAHLSA